LRSWRERDCEEPGEIVDYTKMSIGEWVAGDPEARAVYLVIDVVANTPPDMIKPAAWTRS
jgi:hypothetical protein